MTDKLTVAESSLPAARSAVPPEMQQLIELALEKEGGTEALERIVALSERMADRAAANLGLLWDDGNQAVEIARAVILKWLEQPRSVEMIKCGVEARSFTGLPPLPEVEVSNVYATMCAQAKKEIGGDHG